MSTGTRNVDVRYEQLFHLVTLGVILFLLYESIDLPDAPRLFPMLIGIPASLLIIIRLIMLSKPEYFAGKSFELFDLDNLSDEAKEDDSMERTFSVIGSLKATILFFFYGFSIWVFGFVIGSTLMVFLLFYHFSRLSTMQSVISAIVSGVFVYIVFIFALNVRPIDTVVEILPMIGI